MFVNKVFEREIVKEDPGTFHSRPFDGDLPPGGALWVPQLQLRKTLVLGSSQSPDTIDSGHLHTAGLEMVKRRSGGGAVLVSSEDLVWFDIVIDNNHRHWSSDVSQSFEWLGNACKRGLQSLGTETIMRTGRLQTNDWSRLICFAGLGPGELTHNDRKIVGMSQRRTRDRARFQVAILRRWSGVEHAQLLADTELERVGKSRDQAAVELESVAAGVDHSPGELLDAIIAELG